MISYYLQKTNKLRIENQFSLVNSTCVNIQYLKEGSGNIYSFKIVFFIHTRYKVYNRVENKMKTIIFHILDFIKVASYDTLYPLKYPMHAITMRKLFGR